jgi:hypothetical protein
MSGWVVCVVSTDCVAVIFRGLHPENEGVTILRSLSDTPAHQKRFESLARLL